MSRLWEDTLRIPDALEATLADQVGVREVARVLGGVGVKRVVVSGNGAAWYAGVATWLASLDGPAIGADLTCLPAGLLAQGRFAWRPGDVLVAFSSSGEFRDLVEATAAPDRPPMVAVTANPGSTIGRRAAAKAVAQLPGGGAFTHATAYVANVALGLAILAELTRDRVLRDAILDLPRATARALDAATAWHVEEDLGEQRPRMVLGLGDGPAWAAALETALLAREIARVPAEGAELREGATSSMFGIGSDDLVLIVAAGRGSPRSSGLEDEAAATLAGRGARVIRLPGADLGDRRLSSILAFPASVKIALRLATMAGLDPDDPETADTYYRVARASSVVDGRPSGHDTTKEA